MFNSFPSVMLNWLCYMLLLVCVGVYQVALTTSCFASAQVSIAIQFQAAD